MILCCDFSLRDRREAPKRICDVNKNFKQLSGGFYNRAAALKGRCNREEQNEPDTAIITVVVRKEQPLEGYRKSNSIFTTTQQASMPPAGGKKKVDVTASLEEKKTQVLAVLASTMLLLFGTVNKP